MACLQPKQDREEIYADAALLKLKKSLEFNDYVQPICLPTLNKNVPEKTSCAIAGWGTTKDQWTQKSQEHQQENTLAWLNWCLRGLIQGTQLGLSQTNSQEEE